MNETTAKEVIERTLACADHLEAVVECVRKEADTKEHAALLAAIGEIFSIQTDRIILPIVIQHPALKALVPDIDDS